ncbi:hypothetical protein RQP46_003890 [Phenoliferia psychrophenolica]
MSAPTSATTAPVHRIPAETLCHIFDLAATSCKQTAVQASLVCRSWREPAQRALFLNVELNLQLTDELEESEAKRKCASLLASPAFERHRVRELRLTTGPALADTVTAIIAACTGLKHLALQPIWEALTATALTNLESLHVHYPEHFQHSPGPHAFPFRLTELVIWVFAPLPPCPAAISAISSVSSRSLRRVNIRIQTPDDASWLDTNLLALAGPSVRTLAVTLDERFTRQGTSARPGFNGFSSFANLQTLELVPISFDEPSDHFNATISRLAHAMPVAGDLKTLILAGTHIETSPGNFEPNQFVEVEALLEFLAAPVGTSIKRLDFTALTRDAIGGLHGYANWERLEIYCEENSIVINLREDLLSAGETCLPSLSPPFKLAKERAFSRQGF